MESKTSALKFCRAEENDYEELVQLVSKVLIDGGSLHANQYNFTKWHWKYFEIADAEPRIYICKENNIIIGYYHCPVYQCIIDGQVKKVAMVQDVGMSEAARGKGVFSQLAKFATHDLLNSDISFIITYPNDKSIHTFIKYNGYKKIETLTTFLLPIKSGKILASKLKIPLIPDLIGIAVDGVLSLTQPSLSNDYKVELLETVNEEISDLFVEFNNRYKYSLLRNYDYLHWRFDNKPHVKHYLLIAKHQNKIVAAAIILIDELLGNETAIVIDFAVKQYHESALVQLFVALKRSPEKYFGKSVAMIYTSTISNNKHFFSKAGFFKIPERLNPRPLNLLGKNINAPDDMYSPSGWNITLSEWDVL